MNILFLTKRYYTQKDLLEDRFGRLYHLPKQLSLRGHNVLVIALDYKSFEFKEARENELVIVSVPSGSAGFRLDIDKVLKSSGHGLPFDLVVGAGHLPVVWNACRLAAKLAIPFVLEAYDYYPAFFPFLIRPVGRYWFRKLCRTADGCIAASQRLKDWMQQFNPSSVCIENGLDPQLFRKIDRHLACDELGIDPQKTYIAVVGSTSEDLGYGDFLQALKLLRENQPDIMGLHAGHMDNRYKGSPGVVELGMRRQSEIPLILSAASCAVVPYRPSLQCTFSNSCKLVEYMAVGLPIVATRCGDNARILGAAYPGLVHPYQPELMQEAILSQLTRPVVPDYPENWTWQKLGIRLEEFLMEICCA